MILALPCPWPRVDSVHVVGKTGTADWTPAEGHERTYASFIGIADLPSRQIVALVGLRRRRGMGCMEGRRRRRCLRGGYGGADEERSDLASPAS